MTIENCLHCGGNAGFNDVWVYCFKCGASGPNQRNGSNDAIERWNAIARKCAAHEGMVEALEVIAARTCGSDCRARYMDTVIPGNPRPWARCGRCIAIAALAKARGGKT